MCGFPFASKSCFDHSHSNSIMNRCLDQSNDEDIRGITHFGFPKQSTNNRTLQ